MQLPELKDSIIKKELQNFYLFTGEEIKIMDIYIDKIIKTFDLEPVRVDSVDAVYNRIKNKSLIGKRTCYIISNDADYLKAEKVWERLLNINCQSVIILTYSNLDKRTKFYKQHQEVMTEFGVLSSEMLVKYIQKEVDLPVEFCEQLIAACQSNYNRILFEIDKIKQLASAKNTTHCNAYNLIINENLLHIPSTDMIFVFVDAILVDNSKLAYMIWNKIKMSESSIKVLSLLYTGFRNILSVQLAGNVQNICNYTGLTPWQIKLTKDKLGFFNKNQLINILKLIRWTEKGIKTGLIEDNISVDYVMCEVFNIEGN